MPMLLALVGSLLVSASSQAAPLVHPIHEEALEIARGTQSVEAALGDPRLDGETKLGALLLRGDACDPGVLDQIAEILAKQKGPIGGKTTAFKGKAMKFTETAHEYPRRSKHGTPRAPVHAIPAIFLALRECPDLSAAQRMLELGMRLDVGTVSHRAVDYPEEWEPRAVRQAEIDGAMTWTADLALRVLEAPDSAAADVEMRRLVLVLEASRELETHQSKPLRSTNTLPRLLDICRQRPALRAVCTGPRGEKVVAMLLARALESFPPPPESLPPGDATPGGYSKQSADRPDVLLNRFMAVSVRLGHRPFVELALMMGADPMAPVDSTDIGAAFGAAVVTGDTTYRPAPTVPYRVHGLSFAELARWQGQQTSKPVFRELHDLFLNLGAFSRSEQEVAKLQAHATELRAKSQQDLAKYMEESRKHMDVLYQEWLAQEEVKYGRTRRVNECTQRGVPHSVCQINPDAQPTGDLDPFKGLMNAQHWQRMSAEINATTDFGLPGGVFTLSGGVGAPVTGSGGSSSKPSSDGGQICPPPPTAKIPTYDDQGNGVVKTRYVANQAAIDAYLANNPGCSMPEPGTPKVPPGAVNQE